MRPPGRHSETSPLIAAAGSGAKITANTLTTASPGSSPSGGASAVPTRTSPAKPSSREARRRLLDEARRRVQSRDLGAAPGSLDQRVAVPAADVDQALTRPQPDRVERDGCGGLQRLRGRRVVAVSPVEHRRQPYAGIGAAQPPLHLAHGPLVGGVALLAPGVAVVVVAVALPQARLVVVEQLDRADPLRGLPEVALGDEQPRRAAVLGLERRPSKVCAISTSSPVSAASGRFVV